MKNGTMWSVSEAAFVQIPSEKPNLRKTLINLYTAQSTLTFLLNGGFSIEQFFRIDSELWWSVFTAEQTQALIEAQNRQNTSKIQPGIIQCLCEWETLQGGYLYSLPMAAWDAALALSNEQGLSRQSWLRSLLTLRNAESDRYLRDILRPFTSVIPLEVMLDPVQLRQQCIISIVGLVENCFLGQIKEVLSTLERNVADPHEIDRQRRGYHERVEERRIRHELREREMQEAIDRVNGNHPLPSALTRAPPRWGRQVDKTTRERLTDIRLDYAGI